jgi:hypothetical protein
LQEWWTIGGIVAAVVLFVLIDILRGSLPHDPNDDKPPSDDDWLDRTMRRMQRRDQDDEPW